MKTELRPVVLAVALALGAGAQPLWAQTAPAASGDANAQPAALPTELESILVSGVRAAAERSLEAKRAADSVVDVITAEDVGKMPDKNIADSLSHVPGVTISSAGATEGGFDEADRVSMRGTNPSLTQTLLNGHNVAAGDWFVLDQTGTVGRSVSYTLLPSELVSQVVVHKSSEASLVEGGVAGSVDIITRKPLEFSKTFTAEASAGAVYATLPGKTDPQFSGLIDWKNDAGNVGVLVQAFSEKRHLRRDGNELLGYDTVNTPGPLNGVVYPHLIGEALFEQTRTRTGGLVDLEWKPDSTMKLDLSYFQSNLDAPNFNRNYLLYPGEIIGSEGIMPNPGYTVTNGTLTSATFPAVAGKFYGIYDQISRPDEKEDTNFVNLDGSWRVNDKLRLDGQLGTSQGDGKTPTQNVSETWTQTGTGAGYQLNGIGSGPSYNLGNANVTTPFPGGTAVPFGWIFGAQDVDVKDKEDWLKLDATYQVNDGALTEVLFGVRWEKHDRDSTGAIAQGPTAATSGAGFASQYPTTWSNYPSNFTGFGGSLPSGMWYWTPDQLAVYNGPGNVQRDPILRAYPDYWFDLHETNQAAYVQADLVGSGWSGNVGLRLVRTKEDTITYENDSSVTATTAGAVTTSLFGPYVARPVSHDYTNLLPSANLKLDLDKDLVARFAASQTMTRADYSALSGATTLGAAGTGGNPGSGSTSNPDLKPIVSTNLDAGVEWYFAKHSLLSATAFYMDLKNYISYGSLPLSALTFSAQYPTGQTLNYLMTVPINSHGKVDGLELAYVQEITHNIGVNANYTYANGKQTSDVTNGDDRLVGTSKNTYNISGYFENDMFSARLTYTYRSAFYAGLDRSTAFTQDGVGTLGMSLAYYIDKHLAVTLDGMNLNDPTLKYYALNTDQPRAFYKNGSQYYLNLRYKF
jgi:iron complex outermembrane recepter protein